MKRVIFSRNGSVTSSSRRGSGTAGAVNIMCRAGEATGSVNWEGKVGKVAGDLSKCGTSRSGGVRQRHRRCSCSGTMETLSTVHGASSAKLCSSRMSEAHDGSCSDQESRWAGGLERLQQGLRAVDLLDAELKTGLEIERPLQKGGASYDGV